jgi:hypothetical protein
VEVAAILRSGAQVARGGEVKQLDHRRNRTSGVGQQLGGAGDAGEVDDPLQVGRPTGAELAGEVLPADREPAGELGGADRTLDLAQQQIPRGPLKGLRDSIRGVGQRPAAPAW